VQDFNDEWAQKHLAQRKMNGLEFVLDKETGYLQRPGAYGFNAEKKHCFMGHLNAKFNIARALKEVGMSRKAFYDALAIDPLFREHYTEAVERHVDNAEEKLIQEAESSAFGASQRMFLLKKRRAAVYGDKLQVTTATQNDPLLKALMSKLNDYDLIPKADVLDVKEEGNG
jgi:hypothetical protein